MVALEESGATIAMSLYLVPFAIFIVGLSVFHFYAIFKGLSTKEFVKKIETSRNRGWWANIKGALCSVLPSRLFDPRKVRKSNHTFSYSQAFSKLAVRRKKMHEVSVIVIQAHKISRELSLTIEND